ncbi:aldehyde dehydrogenase family protein [archaeon]|nr:MAG: aldehyde dehydrogenase family protein [archaeon]
MRRICMVMVDSMCIGMHFLAKTDIDHTHSIHRYSLIPIHHTPYPNPDCATEHTINSILSSAFGAAGQRCMALSCVVFVGESKQMIHEITKRAKNLKVREILSKLCVVCIIHPIHHTPYTIHIQVGPGNMDGVDVGPVITKESKARIHAIIQKSVEQGAELLLDGRTDIPFASPAVSQEGNYVGPTILHNVSVTNAGYTEEIFGPVLVTVCVDTLEEAIRYGVCSVWLGVRVG